MISPSARAPLARSRRLPRAARLTLLFLAAAAGVGLVATVYGFAVSGSEIAPPGAALLAGAVLMAVSSGVNLAIRFVRWQFLLRRVGVRVPTLASLAAFLGSFAFLPIPLYLGQLVARARLVPALARAERRRVLAAALWERALDAWTLVLLSLPMWAPPHREIVAAALALAVVPAVRRRVLVLLDRAAGEGARFALGAEENGTGAEEPLATAALARAPYAAIAAVLSLAAWLATAASLAPVAWGAGLALGMVPGIGAAALAILGGAIGLIPLGVGTSGLLLLRELDALAGGGEAAALVVLVFRAATVWLSLGLGATALMVRYRHRASFSAANHFDHIDDSYDAWLPPHFRAHVVAQKMGAMSRYLGALEPGARGLDIGCGRGWYIAAFRAQGVAMVGIDSSRRQLEAARRHPGAEVALVRASAIDLPFAPEHFRFAYMVNVLHHLPTPDHQIRALTDVARRLEPGGLLFVHEMNVVNPLFRFYLGYVFPLLKGIDEGTEPFMDTRRLTSTPELRLAAIEYFTFLPDFVPAALLPRLRPIEAWLERSRWRRYAAHFMAVFERV